MTIQSEELELLIEASKNWRHGLTFDSSRYPVYYKQYERELISAVIHYMELEDASKDRCIAPCD